MDKFAPATPCPYHGLLKPGVKHTNGYKGGRHLQQLQHNGCLSTGGGQQGAPKTMEPIWDIVSGLAQALNDARDQLASLIQSRGNSPLKAAPFAKSAHPSPRPFYNGGNGSNCVNSHGGMSVPRSNTPRCYSSPHSRGRAAKRGEENRHDPHGRNIHRSHAHGYCAFGRNTEFKETMHHARSNRRFPGSGGGGGGGDDGPGGGYGIRLQGGTGACGIRVVPNGKSYTCVRDRDKKGIHLTARMKDCNMNVDTDGEKFGPNNPVKIHFSSPSKVRFPTPYMQPSPEVKRYCVGTQYANLLKEEAHHLRERRIIEEGKILRSTWKHP